MSQLLDQSDAGRPIELRPLERLRGSIAVPGDKSIAHRALLFSAVAEGESRIVGCPTGADVATTRRLLEQLGVPMRDDGATLIVEGRGYSALDAAAPALLDCGNSGTTTRLLLGLLAARRGRYRLVGDPSLSRRPMARLTDRLRELGGRFSASETLPIEIEGATLRGAQLQTGVASAQVKSALLLAALQAEGESRVEEPLPTRDHSERMLRSMGAPLVPDGARAWRVAGGAPRLAPLQVEIPGDPSSAAFLLALALLLPASELRVERLLLNPRRLGFVRLLQRMGGRLTAQVELDRIEPIGTLSASSSRLQGIAIEAEEVVDAIDELPLLAVIATQASGTTTIRGAAELRHKESDRIAATVAMLTAFGATVTEHPDGMTIAGGTRLRGAEIDSFGDHRIAMASAVAAALADRPSRLSGAGWIEISFPRFFETLYGCA